MLCLFSEYALILLADMLCFSLVPVSFLSVFVFFEKQFPILPDSVSIKVCALLLIKLHDIVRLF